MERIAEHYPTGLEPDAPLREAILPPDGGAPCLRRELTPAAAEALAAGLRGRAQRLRQVPAERLLGALARLHREWARPESPWRQEAVEALEPVTGYARPAIDRCLRALFRAMDRRAMEGWLAAAGIPLAALDGAVGGLRVLGPALTVVIASGNVPGAALPSVVQALLLKSPCLTKTSASEPLLLPLYARALAALAPEVADGLAVTGWEGGRADLEAPVLARADALVVYGENSTLADLRARAPIHVRLIGYGSRISFAAIARERLTRRFLPALARRAALDIGLFDQQGCFSPQAIYVERGGAASPEMFAAALAKALAELERELPRRRLTPAEAAAIHQYRVRIEMRSRQDPRVRLWTSREGTLWTVALDPEPDLEPCCLNRTAIVRPLDDLAALPARVAPAAPFLSTAAVAAPEERLPKLAAALAEAGVTRICPLGQAQFPHDPAYHDGVNALATLARFVRIESG